MKILSIEPTPSPHSMKIIVDQTLPDRETHQYKKDDAEKAPLLIKEILQIDGVKGLFRVADFIALDRLPTVPWEQILPKVKEAFGENVAEDTDNQDGQPLDSFGEVQVFVQFFRGIPMQIKLVAGDEEKRVGLPERFQEAIMKAQSAGKNIVMEREWKERGTRYGDLEEVGQTMADEISAAYDSERLKRLVTAALENKTSVVTDHNPFISAHEVEIALQSDDWKDRFSALEKMDPKIEDIPILAKALDDEKASIRRLATVFLGMLEDEETLPLLVKALKDKSVSVRRTAGDCFSDLGSKKAIPAMIEALKDKNKLVRWRAAMFLYEVGDETAVAALKEAENDPEFEVGLQAKMARQRIESGEKAAGSIWQQMAESRKGKESG